jgi:DNA-binding transcriptional LysR family regulator
VECSKVKVSTSLAKQPFGTRLQLLARLTLNAGKYTADQPARLAHLDDGNVRAILVQRRGTCSSRSEGAGLVYAPAWSVMNFVKAGRLKVILSEHELPPHPIIAVFTHNRLLSGKVRALVDYLALQFVDTDFDSPPPLHTARLG